MTINQTFVDHRLGNAAIDYKRHWVMVWHIAENFSHWVLGSTRFLFYFIWLDACGINLRVTMKQSFWSFVHFIALCSFKRNVMKWFLQDNRTFNKSETKKNCIEQKFYEHYSSTWLCFKPSSKLLNNAFSKDSILWTLQCLVQLLKIKLCQKYLFGPLNSKHNLLER